MRMPATIRWAGLALLGLLIAAGVSIAAGSLASQQIGLSSEPVSAGDSLAPPAVSRSHRHLVHRHASPTGTTGPSSPVQAVPPTPAVEPAPQVGAGQSEEEGDHGAEGGGSADD